MRHPVTIVVSGNRVISETGGPLRLHHGTDIESATYIANSGVSYEKLNAIAGGDDFWMTSEATLARDFAGMNPVGGPPSLLSFDLSVTAINTCLSREWAVLHDECLIQFFPQSFEIVNTTMSNVMTLVLPPLSDE